MGVFTFVCRNLGGSWTSKQQAKEDHNEENDDVSEDQAAESEDIAGGSIPIVLTDRSTNDPGFVFVRRDGGEEDLEASASKEEDNEVFEEKVAAAAAEEDILGGIPNVLTDRSTKKPGVVFVLEKASLEVGKIGKSNDHYTYQLLNWYDHAHMLRKINRDPAQFRPDITHRALVTILDSPVNKAGRLKAVYVKTEKGVLFEVKPHVLIPRTFKGFARLILQLPQSVDGSPMQLPQKQSSITADGSPERLLRCIENPVEKYLPVNSRKIGLSHSSEKLVNMQKHLSTVCNNDTDIVFVLGAMARGKIECDYIDDFVSISEYPLTSSCCVSRICEALSTNWNIL